MAQLYSLLVCITLLSSACYAQSNVVELSKERQKVELDFNATYKTYINQDIETAIILPPGYKYVACQPGSRDFISASPLQNTMYISCPVDHEVFTNLTLHVITPEGAEEKLIFKLTGKRGVPKVLAIEFERPNNSEINRTVEAVKARYTEQMANKLSDQDKELRTAVHKETIMSASHLFPKNKRGKIREEYNGAWLSLDGVINSRGNSYFYIKTASYKDGCDVVKLLWADDKKHKNTDTNAEFIGISENDDGTFTYIYSVPEIFIPKKGYKKIRMGVMIWSKFFQIKFKAS